MILVSGGQFMGYIRCHTHLLLGAHSEFVGMILVTRMCSHRQTGTRLYGGIMRVSCVVALVLSCALSGSAFAQSQPLSERLVIQSSNLPADELSLLESQFACSSCKEADIQESVREKVRGLGYFKAVVSNPVITTMDSNGEHVVRNTVAVDAGARYYVGDIEINGAKLLPMSQLLGAMPLRPGMVFSATLLGMGLENLRKVYAGFGHPNMVAVPSVRIDELHHVVTLTLDIDEG
ncbi:MAG TPA: POTRA domain-containing protein [Terriglobus sp.]